MWIARSCRPGISYSVSKLQSASLHPFSAVSEILLCNSMLKVSQEDPTVWLIFKSVLAWSSQAGALVQMCIAAVSEASHGNASAYPDRFGVRRAFRSQGGKVLFLTTKDLCETQERSRAHHHIRQCRAEASCRWHNQKAEPFQLCDVVDTADVLRACIADADGHSIWERSAASYIEERVAHRLSQLLRHVAATWCQNRGQTTWH